MQLSTDGQILLNVTNEDLDNGTFVLPEGVTSIGDGAFSYCTGLTQITLAEALTSIGDRAFASCTGLTQIILPDGLTFIGDRAFMRCTGLTQITLPDAQRSPHI